MRKIRTDITVETEEILIIRWRRNLARPECAWCGERTRMISLEEAIALGGVSSRAIYRRVAAGEIHYEETPGGLLLVCPNSLLGPGVDAS